MTDLRFPTGFLWGTATAPVQNDGSFRERGMEPMLTLHHFSDPLWFVRRGVVEQRHPR